MRVTYDVGAIMPKVELMQKKALRAASEQALFDANFYAPQRYGILIGSSQAASDIDEGHLVWQTPYARRLYYENTNLSQHPNPNASHMWADVARDNHLDDWIKAAERALGKP